MLTRIKQLRNEYGISQQKLADGIRTSQPSINKYENHNIEPDISALIAMADYFETSVDYIVGHTPIRRKIEEVSDFALNEREAAVLNGYRSLAEPSRKVVDDLVAEMARIGAREFRPAGPAGAKRPGG